VRIARALQSFEERQDNNGIDPAFARLPVTQGKILTAFYSVAGLSPPRTKQRLKQAAVAAETLYQELGSADKAASLVRQFFRRRADGHPDCQFTVHGPWSVVNAVIALAGDKEKPKLDIPAPDAERRPSWMA
jgi:hypothetical protein